MKNSGRTGSETNKTVVVRHDIATCHIPSGSRFPSISAAVRAFCWWNLFVRESRGSARSTHFCDRVPEYSGDAELRFYRACGSPIPAHVIGQSLVLSQQNSLFCRMLYRENQTESAPAAFRRLPVPKTGRWHRQRIRRRIKTTQERLTAAFIVSDEEMRTAGVRVRAKRGFASLPEFRDDIYRGDRDNNGWKANRKTRWRSEP